MRSTSWMAAAWALALANSVGAEVTVRSNSGFVSRNEVVVPVEPQEAWQALVRPGAWWDSEHTYSADAANMTLLPGPGGCFCETVPPQGDAAEGQVEHMRVLNAQPARLLRLSGGLGPLQSEAATGVLTVQLEPAESGTRIIWEYVVGGFMRMKLDELAPVVDQVLALQLARLASLLETGGPS